MSEGNSTKPKGPKKPVIVPNDTEEQNNEPMHELEDFSDMDPREIDRYKLAFRGTNDGLWDWDLRTNEVYFSPSWKSMLGFLEDEIGSSKDEWFGRIHPEDMERIKLGVDISLDELNGHYEDVYRMLHEDGTYRWVLCRGIVLRNADGKPYRMVGSNTDISERMWTEERLKQVASELEKKNIQVAFSNQRLEAVLNSTGDAIAMFSVEKQLLFANHRYMEMFGLSDESLKTVPGEELWQRIAECFQEPELYGKAIASFTANPENELEEMVEMKSPQRRMLYHLIAPVHYAEEDIIGYITVYRDISKEIQADQMKAEVLRLRAELEAEYSFDNIVGGSAGIREVYALIQQASQSNIAVLIHGESGTGKELVARAIHFNSSRKTGPFVAVNCVAIPETLIESELFGHESGAFTGASARKIGRFEQADGGTILLDEIGEVPISLQTRFLRVLQEREIQRVGGTSTIPVDVRVIATTNRDLDAAMKADVFREDLFYRIAAFPIFIPPLRERREDIPLLAENFLGRAGQKAGKSISVISTEAMRLLIDYDWPGNVRELENAIERGVLLETSGMLQADNLPLEIRSTGRQFYISVPEGEYLTTTQIPRFEEVEKRLLQHALKVTGYNITETARALGIGRVTVYRKLEKYNLLERD
ncbi:sigma 54-interacting transcriptional regulator [Candidatus Poribacteria bacterium]